MGSGQRRKRMGVDSRAPANGIVGASTLLRLVDQASDEKLFEGKTRASSARWRQYSGSLKYGVVGMERALSPRAALEYQLPFVSERIAALTASWSYLSAILSIVFLIRTLLICLERPSERHVQTVWLLGRHVPASTSIAPLASDDHAGGASSSMETGDRKGRR